MIERIGRLVKPVELLLDSKSTRQGGSQSGPVLAVRYREGSEAEAGRAVPIIESVQTARFLSFCKRSGDAWQGS